MWKDIPGGSLCSEKGALSLQVLHLLPQRLRMQQHIHSLLMSPLPCRQQVHSSLACALEAVE